MSLLTLLVIFALSVNSGDSSKHEWDTPRCKVNDNECLLTTINYYIKNGAKGIPSINLKPIDPLFVPEIDIYQGDESPVSIALKFRNASFRGLSTFNVTRVSGFIKDPKNTKFELFGRIPKISLSGFYNVRGNIIIFPVIGNGTAIIEYENVDTYARLTPKIVTRKNKEYVDIKSLKLDVNTTRVHMNFENIFNGDKRLSKAINDFINENWREIYSELKGITVKITSNIISSILKPVFDKYPYQDIWLDD